jgi:hypothetical protein
MEISTFQGSGALSVAPVPGDPRGDHTFSVTQPNMAQITGAFTVAAATRPRVVSLTRAGSAGTTFRIGVAGFPGEVALYLYKTQQIQDPANRESVEVSCDASYGESRERG